MSEPNDVTGVTRCDAQQRHQQDALPWHASALAVLLIVVAFRKDLELLKPFKNSDSNLHTLSTVLSSL